MTGFDIDRDGARVIEILTIALAPSLDERVRLLRAVHLSTDELKMWATAQLAVRIHELAASKGITPGAALQAFAETKAMTRHDC